MAGTQTNNLLNSATGSQLSCPHARPACALALLILLAVAGTAQADIFPDSFSDMAATLRADFATPELPANISLIDQRGGSANRATIDQGGAVGANGNYAEINQNGLTNQASTVQTGDSNRARVDQTGSSNIVNITQDGTGNSLDLVQDGSDNFMDLSQTGYANLLQGSQTGDNNSIVVNQNGMPTTVVEGGHIDTTVNVSPDAPSVSITIVGSGMSVTVY